MAPVEGSGSTPACINFVANFIFWNSIQKNAKVEILRRLVVSALAAHWQLKKHQADLSNTKNEIY